VGFGSALSGFTSTNPPPATITISSTTTSFYHGAVVTTSGRFITVSNAVGDTLGGGFGNDHAVRIVTTYLEPAGSPYSGQIVVTSNDTSNATVLVPVTVSIVTAVGEMSGVPGMFALHQNYPNPWNPSTTLCYDLPQNAFVTLTVYNTLGQQVAQLVDEEQELGSHEVVFRGDGLASGVYFYRLKAGDFSQVKKLILLR
jgi:hypothetical protein